MSDMSDDGEPASVGRRDRRAAKGRALWGALLVAAFFGIVVLFNGILAILLVAWWQAIGWWETGALLESTEGLASQLTALRVQLDWAPRGSSRG